MENLGVSTADCSMLLLVQLDMGWMTMKVPFMLPFSHFTEQPGGTGVQAAQEGVDIHSPPQLACGSERGGSRMVVLYISCRNQSTSSGSCKLWTSSFSIPKNKNTK